MRLFGQRGSKNASANISVRNIGRNRIAIKTATSVFTITTDRLAELTVVTGASASQLVGRYHASNGHDRTNAIDLARFETHANAEMAQEIIFNELTKPRFIWWRRAGYVIATVFVMVAISNTGTSTSHAQSPFLNPATGPAASLSPASDPSAAIAAQPDMPYVFQPKVKAPAVDVPTLNCDAGQVK